MNELFFVLIVLALAIALLGLHRWVYQKSHSEQRRRKAQGYQLIYALNAYSAWLDFLPCEPFIENVQDQLPWPESLKRAREITRVSFPDLLPQVLRLLEGDTRLMGFMWQHELRQLSQPAPLCTPGRDPDYQQIRDDQELLIEQMITRCRELIGDRAQAWRRTGDEFDFSGGSQTPATSG
jgi:hypothetical protein